MAFLTKSELISKASFETKSFYDKYTITEAINKRSKRSSQSDEITVFVSHKHDDAEEFQSVLRILSALGIKLYLDWQDGEMPKETCGETAIKLKNKIRSCQKFLLVATENAIASKWCNWELGYGDAHKFLKNIAIFPVFNNDRTWKGNEYLQIYPAIEYWQTSDQYIVKYPDGKIDYIEEWLNN